MASLALCGLGSFIVYGSSLNTAMTTQKDYNVNGRQIYLLQTYEASWGIQQQQQHGER